MSVPDHELDEDEYRRCVSCGGLTKFGKLCFTCKLDYQDEYAGQTIRDEQEEA